MSAMISVNIYRSRNELYIDIRNPYQPTADRPTAANKMALDNIRERAGTRFSMPKPA